MKNFFIIITFLFSLSAVAQVEKAIPERPTPPKLVNDFAGILTQEQESVLEEKLVAYDRSTSNQIAIVTVTDIKGYSAGDYATALGRKWGVGNSNFDNGVVVLVVTGGGEGNRDVFIAPGYGLEGAIPDLTAKSIIDNELIPNLRTGNYYGALDKATDAIFEAAEGRYKAPAGYGQNKSKAKGIAGIIIVIMIIIFTIIGRSGGRGGGMASRRGWGDFATGWIIGSMLGGMGRGGGSGGGWSGGGGGGFGGFGGGGFGGGGAGGKW